MLKEKQKSTLSEHVARPGNCVDVVVMTVEWEEGEKEEETEKLKETEEGKNR